MSVPRWLIVLAWLLAILTIATGAGGYFAAEAMFETIDLEITEAWFVVKTWAARNVAIGLFIAYAAWRRSKTALSMAFLLHLFVDIQDAIIGFYRPSVGPEVGPMSLVFAALSLFAIWSLNRIKLEA